MTPLTIHPGERIAIIGSGGKTSLMTALARACPGRVIMTTTTHLAPPASAPHADSTIACAPDVAPPTSATPTSAHSADAEVCPTLTASDITAPDITTSDITTSDITTSDISASDITASGITTSDIAASDITTSDITTSDISASDIAASNITASDVTMSNTTASDIAASDVTSAAHPSAAHSSAAHSSDTDANAIRDNATNLSSGQRYPGAFVPFVNHADFAQRWEQGDKCLLTARLDRAADRLTGLTPAEVDALCTLPGLDCLIVEADGSKRLPIKAHKSTEPVLFSRCTLGLAVIGMKALHRQVREGEVHRPELLRALLRCSAEHRLTAADLAHAAQAYLAHLTMPWAECATSRAECAAQQAECATARAECATAQAECATAQAECATAQAECATRRAECATRRAECATSRAECATQQAECATQQAECAFQRPYSPHPPRLGLVLSQAEHGSAEEVAEVVQALRNMLEEHYPECELAVQAREDLHAAQVTIQ